VKPPLEQSIGERIVLTFVIVVAVLLLMALIGWLIGGWDDKAAAQEQEIILMLPPTKWDEKMDELDRQAVDEAYVNKIKQLFDVWVREGLSSSEPVTKGHAQARRAYIAAHRAMEKRDELRREQQR